MTLKTILSFSILIVAFFGNAQLNKSQAFNVVYSPLNGYFVKNTWNKNKTKILKFTSQAQLEKVFGMATVMGENGKPTPVDFTKSTVIALILPKTDALFDIKMFGLNKINKQIAFSYSYVEKGKTTAISQPFLLIQMDKTIKGKIKAIKQNPIIESNSSLKLTGNQWIIEVFNSPQRAVDFKNCYFTIDEKTISFYGSDGCNTFGGKVNIDGNKISFSEIMSTLKACENMQQSEVFMKNLEEIDSYKIDGGELFLYKKDVLVMTMESFR
jgi:heat shock protein HslJ